ncbi:hypothetical protein RRG08_022777 [Elysia crispata]|uniref:Neurotransmitter-gated ion-channel ligand-binding domain-containing protein n=1 Tax=Elysia crispata TaxID=231223 RepID=A0AAE1A3E4_9GAST|nr:hypothetical protein RRG08_022777 [Elysia crispata]
MPFWCSKVTDKANCFVRCFNHVTDNTFSFFLQVNEKDQNLGVHVWMALSWSDFLLSWQPQNFGNISSFLVRQEDIWLSDIQVANSVVKQMQLGVGTLSVWDRNMRY